MGKGHQLGLTEAGLTLKGLFIIEEELADQVLQIDVLGRRCLLEGGPGDFWKCFQRKVLLLPVFLDCAAELFKIGIHGGEGFVIWVGRLRGMAVGEGGKTV